jgi:hypothetical protein
MTVLILGFPRDIHIHAVRWAIEQAGGGITPSTRRTCRWCCGHQCTLRKPRRPFPFVMAGAME